MRTTRIIKISDSNTELGVESKEPEVVEKNELKDIPPKQLFNYNLKQLKSFKKIRQSYKLKNLNSICFQKSIEFSIRGRF